MVNLEEELVLTHTKLLIYDNGCIRCLDDLMARIDNIIWLQNRIAVMFRELFPYSNIGTSAIY